MIKEQIGGEIAKELVFDSQFEATCVVMGSAVLVNACYTPSIEAPSKAAAILSPGARRLDYIIDYYYYITPCACSLVALAQLRMFGAPGTARNFICPVFHLAVLWGPLLLSSAICTMGL